MAYFVDWKHLPVNARVVGVLYCSTTHAIGWMGNGGVASTLIIGNSLTIVFSYVNILRRKSSTGKEEERERLYI